MKYYVTMRRDSIISHVADNLNAEINGKLRPKEDVNAKLTGIYFVNTRTERDLIDVILVWEGVAP